MAKAEELLAEELAGFRPGTVEHIFNTPARSVPQLHGLQEGVWQSLSCRPVAGPLKLRHRGRSGSSHSGTILELQQCDPLEQSARERKGKETLGFTSTETIKAY